MSTIFEGIGKPKIIFHDGSFYTFPEPIGPDKDGLRLYDFEIFTRDQYWSEGGKKNVIGKKFIFNANLKWISLSKEALKKLWKAMKDESFQFVLNADEDSIKYWCEVKSLQYKFFKGIPNHRAGYTVQLKLAGTDLVSDAGYEAEISDSGFGTDFGEEVGNQTP